LAALLATQGAEAQSAPPPPEGETPAPSAPAKGARVVLPAPAPGSAQPPAQSAPASAEPPAAPPATVDTPPGAAPLPPPADAPPAPAALPPPTPSYPTASGYPTPGGPNEPPGYYGSYASTEGSYDEATPYNIGSRKHDGFFLRISVGVGAGLVGYRESIDGRRVSDVTTRGLAGLLGVSVGGAVIENLILHGDIVASGYGDAERELDGTPDARDEIDGSLALLGGGATYYFMPTNAYITLVVGAAGFSEQRDGEDAIESGIGIGLSTLVGKEWWVGRSAEWGLGAGLRAGFYSAPLEIAYVDSRLRAFDIGLVFGATYN
jgi:hypothetical protein